jgi:biopolymer transport protein ExbB/TolQ
MSFITEAFQHGGIWMYAILGVQIVSLAIIAERFYALYLKRSVGQKRLAAHFEDDIKRGNIEQAQNKARSMSQSQALGSIAAAGMQAAINMGGKEEIHARMEEMVNVENAKLEKRTALLGMIGNVATLIGLLGTITGMIKSFSAVGMASAAEKATLLSSGISEAMNCTAYGLIVAIPALVLHSVLTNRTNELQEDLNQASTKVLNWLSYNFDSVPRSSRKKSI